MRLLDGTERFSGFLRESPVTVIAGSEKTVYYVHPGVLSACKSSTADVRMSGHWKETGEGAIDWTSFDRQTIECVLHYLYTGDYYAPDTSGETLTPATEYPEIGLEETEVALHTHEPSLGYDEPAPSQSPSPGETPLARPLTPISDLFEDGLPVERVQTAAGVAAEAISKRDGRGIGTSILTHAKVYLFAYQNFFSDLAKHALQRLTQMLHLAPCEPVALFPYLAEAIRIVYYSTPGPELQQDPARKLLSQYVALNYTFLVGEDLDRLAEDGGEFMIDISRKLARVIATSGPRIRSLEDQNDILSVEARKAREETEEWKVWNKGLPYKYRR